jgi:hypothetical protein
VEGLDDDDLDTLADAVRCRIAALQDEVAHTESFAMQRALRADIDRLDRVLTKLSASPPPALEPSGVAASPLRAPR